MLEPSRIVPPNSKNLLCLASQQSPVSTESIPTMEEPSLPSLTAITPARLEVTRGTHGVAFVCAEDGSVRRIIWDDIGIAPQASAGELFVRLVRPADAVRAAQFVESVRAGKIVADCDLFLGLSDRDLRFKFFGCRFGAQSLLLVGSMSRSRLVRLLEQLLRASGEQTSTLRALVEDSHRRLQEAAERNLEAFQEIAVLRSELAEFRLETARRAHVLEREAELSVAEAMDRTSALRAIVEDRGSLARDLAAAGDDETAALVAQLSELSADVLARLDAKRPREKRAIAGS